MADISKATGIAGLIFLLPSVQAQQFTGHLFPYEYFNLSSPCLEALNTTLECSGRLALHASFESHRVDVLDADGIAAICTDDCRESMQNLRSKIQDDCNPTSDLLDHGLKFFPATHIVDRYIYAYEMSCYKNRDTGDFCDYVLSEWRNQTDDSPHNCDDCILGPMEIEVNSEIGYTEGRSAEFQSAISSCSKTGYTFIEPTTHSSTSAAPAESTVAALGWSAHRMSSNCASTYHVQEGDTCESISADQSVSTKGLIEGNDVLNGWCEGLKAGQDLCMPEQCKVHFVESADSCESLGDKYDATPKDLAEWNPMMYIQCDDFKYLKPTYICVGPPISPQKVLKTPHTGKNSTLQTTVASNIRPNSTLLATRLSTSTSSALEAITTSDSSVPVPSGFANLTGSTATSLQMTAESATTLTNTE